MTPATLKLLLLNSGMHVLVENAWDAISPWIVDMCTSRVTISEENVHAWLVEWLLAENIGDRTTRLMAQEYSPEELVDNLDKLSSRVVFLPGEGSHLLKIEDKWVMLSRGSGDTKISDGYIEVTSPSFTLKTLGPDTEFLKKLVRQAETAYREARQDKLATYVADRWGTWHEHTVTDPRPWDSIVLRKGVKESLLEDVKKFWNSREFYITTGIPFRRGYLLYGQPGCGKSSLVKALASELGIELYVLALSTDMTDDSLTNALRRVPPGALLLIEDIESAYSDSKSGDKISRTGLLNALDGVISGDGRVVFMTTNSRELLDDALLRPGRIDKEVELETADKYQIRLLVRRFIPEWNDTVVENFATQHEGNSPAFIQGKLLESRESTHS